MRTNIIEIIWGLDKGLDLKALQDLLFGGSWLYGRTDAWSLIVYQFADDYINEAPILILLKVVYPAHPKTMMEVDYF